MITKQMFVLMSSTNPYFKFLCFQDTRYTKGFLIHKYLRFPHGRMCFHTVFKISITIQIHKIGNKETIKDFRLISLSVLLQMFLKNMLPNQKYIFVRKINFSTISLVSKKV